MEYKVIRKKVKRISIRVTEEGEVKITCPHHINDKKVKEIIDKNLEWINNKVRLAKSRNENLEHMWYLGERYKIELWDEMKFCLDKEKGGFFVHRNYVKEGLREFYTLMGKRELSLFTKECCERSNTEINSLSLKWMKTRWGSCNHKKRYINLNYELMKYPVDSIKYVIYHELAHIYEGNHGRGFWEKVSEFEPRYKELMGVFKTPLK